MWAKFGIIPTYLPFCNFHFFASKIRRTLALNLRARKRAKFRQKALNLHGYRRPHKSNLAKQTLCLKNRKSKICTKHTKNSDLTRIKLAGLDMLCDQISNLKASRCFRRFFASKKWVQWAYFELAALPIDLRASADDRVSKQPTQGLLRYLTKRQRSQNRRFLDSHA